MFLNSMQSCLGGIVALAVITMSTIDIVFPIPAVFFTHGSYAGEDPANELFSLLSSLFIIWIFLLLFCLGLKGLFRAAFH
jgi:hypothetical protein